MVHSSETSAKIIKDPVCGLDVHPANAKGQSQHQGRTYSFCSLSCKKKFDLNPGQYVRSDTPRAGMRDLHSPSTSIPPSTKLRLPPWG